MNLPRIPLRLTSTVTITLARHYPLDHQTLLTIYNKHLAPEAGTVWDTLQRGSSAAARATQPNKPLPNMPDSRDRARKGPSPAVQQPPDFSSTYPGDELSTGQEAPDAHLPLRAAPSDPGRAENERGVLLHCWG